MVLLHRRALFLLCIASAGLIGAAVGVAPAAPLPGYRLEAVWAATAHSLPAPNSIAVDEHDQVWLLDGPAGEAVALAPDGTVAERRPVPTDALDLAAAPGGDLYFGRWTGRPPPGQRMDNVGRYDTSSAAVWVRQCDCATGSGVAATPGRVWLTEPGDKAMTWLGSVDGRTRGQIVPRSAENGFPADIAAAPDGTVFGTDLTGGAVYAWPAPYLPDDFATWTMLESSGPFRVAAGAQHDGAVVIAVLFSDGLVRVHRPDGTLLARFFVPGEPLDLAVGQESRIYVLDEDTAEVRVYVPGPPPTSTPVPPDPPRVPGSCRVNGTRALAPSQLDDCGRTEVTLQLDASCPPGAVAGAEVVLIIDHSLSMIKGTPVSQMAAAREAAHRFLAGLDLRYHRAAVVGFSVQATVTQPLTADRAALDAAIDTLKPHGSGTDIHAALRTAMDHISSAGRQDALPAIVLLTDGEPNRPVVPEPDTAALVAAERARARRAYIVTIGLGRFVDSLLLESIASSKDDFYYSPSVVDLNRIYDTILQVIEGISLTDLVIEDTPAQPFVRYVPGSGQPPPLVVHDTLTWTRPVLPSGGLTFTYSAQVGTPGRSTVGHGRVLYTDGDGTRRTYFFPDPPLEVVLPTPTPAPLGPPSVPPPIPPAPPTPNCSADRSWYLQLTVFPDTVGRGPFSCPGCNGTFDSGDHWSAVGVPLGPATLAVTDIAGTALWVGQVPPAASGPGRMLVHLCSPPPYRVSLLRAPSGYLPCPNSPAVREVDAEAFGSNRYGKARFALWAGCDGTRPPVPPPPAACP